MKHMVKQPFQDRRAWKKQQVHKTMEHYRIEKGKEKKVYEQVEKFKDALNWIKQAWETVLKKVGEATKSMAKMISEGMKNVVQYYTTHKNDFYGVGLPQPVLNELKAYETNKDYFKTYFKRNKEGL